MRLRVAGLSLVLGACVSIPSAKDAHVSYATTPSSWPAATTCLNKAVMDGPAKEVLHGGSKTVVIAGGDRAISDAQWATYSPSLGNQKNSDRHTMFTRSCFSRSPSRAADCVGDACREIIELDGYTWVGLSKIEAADCVPSASACDGTTPKPGGLLFVVTRKCHELVFEGDVYVLRGPRGEQAVMHATADGQPTTEVTLPEGWTLAKETLPAPMTLHPFGGGDACFYNILRDHRMQSYHQVAYAAGTYP